MRARPNTARASCSRRRTSGRSCRCRASGSAASARRTSASPAGCGLELRLGCELTPSEDLLLEDPRRYALEGLDAVLMEVPFTGPADLAWALAAHAEAHGLLPVIAHPERSEAVLDDPDLGLPARGARVGGAGERDAPCSAATAATQSGSLGARRGRRRERSSPRTVTERRARRISTRRTRSSSSGWARRTPRASSTAARSACRSPSPQRPSARIPSRGDPPGGGASPLRSAARAPA